MEDEVVDTGTEDAPGAPIDSVTQTVAVPFRPAADETCTGGGWRSDLGCISGVAFNVTFDLSELGVTLDGPVFVAVAYNTNYGDTPMGVTGRYDALRVGVTSAAPSVGTAGDTFLDFGTGLTNSGGSSNIMMRLGLEDPATADPATPDDCKDGGYEAFGFRNQGQCVASVKASENAGK